MSEDYQRYLQTTFNEDYFSGKSTRLPDFTNITKMWNFPVNRYREFHRFRHVFELIDYDITQKSRIVSLGCGLGYDLLYLGIAGFIYLYGVDVSQYALRRLWFANDDIKTWCAPLHQLPADLLHEPKFDLAVCLEVLEHIPEKYLPASLASIAKIIGKHVVFSMPLSDEETPEVTHVTIKPREWWETLLAKYFNYCAFRRGTWHFHPKNDSDQTVETGWNFFYCTAR